MHTQELRTTSTEEFHVFRSTTKTWYAFPKPVCKLHLSLHVGAVPSFTPTSSRELDDLLTSFRTNVFLPSHLSRSHQDLVFKGKLHRTLDAEPIYATIAGEKFHLQHLDRSQDVPGRDHVKKAIRLMKESKDWDNLPAILIGFKDAKNPVESWRLIAFTRKAGQAGRLDVILECARRVSDTGFCLSDPTLTTEIMWQLQHKAVRSRWLLKETHQALSWAEMISELLEDKRHAGGKVIDPERDVRVQSGVIGVLLQLSAARAYLFHDGMDSDGKVAQYAAKLLGSPVSHVLGFENWRDMIKPRHLARAEEKATTNQHKSDVVSLNQYLTYVVPVLHGLKLASQVLGPVDGLMKLAHELEISIDAQRGNLLKHGDTDSPGGHKLRGLEIYEQLLSPDAKMISTANRDRNGNGASGIERQASDV